VWFVAVRTISDKADKDIDVKHIGHFPRGHTPEPHQIDDQAYKAVRIEEGGAIWHQI